MAIARAITGTAWSARHGMARDESHQDGVANSLLHCGISVVLTVPRPEMPMGGSAQAEG